MPWKKKKINLGTRRSLYIALTAAVLGGVLACFLGSLLHERGSALAAKYTAYKSLKSLIGNRSPSEIQAAMDRRGIKAP